MRNLKLALILTLLPCSAICADAQSGACANPSSPRIGTMTMTKTPDSDSQAEVVALLSRRQVAENKLRDELVKRLPNSVCVVTNADMAIFSDPKNFPHLKGSASFEITATPSLANSNVFALSITLTSVQGPYFENQLLLFSCPVLIENNLDYAAGAETIIKMWELYGEALKNRKS